MHVYTCGMAAGSSTTLAFVADAIASLDLLLEDDGCAFAVKLQHLTCQLHMDPDEGQCSPILATATSMLAACSVEEAVPLLQLLLDGASHRQDYEQVLLCAFQIVQCAFECDRDGSCDPCRPVIPWW